MVCRPPAPRAGAVLPLVAILMIFLMGMVAFGVDLGYVAVAQKEMQNAADSAALAGTAQLLDRRMLTGTPNQAGAISNARTTAQQFSLKNTGGGVALQLDANNSNDPAGDIVCGYLANPNDLSSPLDTSAATYNSVQVRIRRSAAINGSLKLFFGGALGHSTQDMAAKATATYKGGGSIVGFKVAAGSSTNAKLLPFALDVNTWNAAVNGNTGLPDLFSYNPITKLVTLGSDGIREINLYPQKGIAPGNFGTVNIGTSNNSTATVIQQILNGIGSNDLAGYGGQLVLGNTGTITLSGNPGISAAFKDSLTAIIGQPRVIPIFSPPVIGNGTNSNFSIVGFGGIIITQVKLTGLVKQLTIQPEFVIDPTAVTSSSTGAPSAFVYKPLRITR